MKKSIILLFFLFTQIFPQNKPYDFRHIRWGMSRNQVVIYEEDNPFINSANLLVYKPVYVDGLDATLGYYFNERDSLYSGMYIFQEEHSNPNLYIDDYNSIKRLLVEKYGNAYQDTIVWSNSLLKNSPGGSGDALEGGYVSFAAKWETKNTEISLMLSGDNYKVFFSLDYESKNIIHKDEQKSEGEGL